MASTFKWLLGLHGSAITYMSPELRDRFSLAGVGWYSVQNSFTAVRSNQYDLKPGASCLVAGMPNFASLYAIEAALRFLHSLDLPAEQKRANLLTRDLRRRLAEEPRFRLEGFLECGPFLMPGRDARPLLLIVGFR